MMKKSSNVPCSNDDEHCAMATMLPKHSYTTVSSFGDRTMFDVEIEEFTCDNRLVPIIRLIFSQCDLISISATPRGRCFCDKRRTGALINSSTRSGEFVLVVDAEVVDDATVVVALFLRTVGIFCNSFL